MKKIIVIGGGVAGLFTGIYAQQCGFDTEIYEMHTTAGGLCTGWNRKGYCFDGCIRYVYGSGEGRMCNELMKKAGVAGLEYVHHGESVRVDTGEGKVVFYCDLNRLREHLIDISPGDAKRINSLVNAALSLTKTVMPATGANGFRDIVNIIAMTPRLLPVIMKYAKMTLSEFAAGFESASLRTAFLKYYGYADLNELPMFVPIMDMAEHHVNNAGWPLGGSLGFAERLKSTYASLGGKIYLGSKVESILAEDGCARGVRLANGSELKADYVVAACDAKTVLDNMLEGKYTPPAFEKAFKSGKVIPALVQVSLGVADKLEGVPHSAVLRIEEPVTIAGLSYDFLSYRDYGYDPGMAPEGKSAVTVVYETEYEAWEEIARDKQRYSAEKESAAAQTADRLEKRFPQMRGRIEVIDVATPMTYERYTGNYKGSPQGWQTLKGYTGMLPRKLPGLKRFCMAGQWVQRGGGIPGGAISAYGAVKCICRELGVRFVK